MAEYSIYKSQYTAQQIEASIGKNPRIGENRNWEVWDIALMSWIDTGVASKGDKGDNGDKGDKGDKGDTGNPGGKMFFTTLPTSAFEWDGCTEQFIIGSDLPYVDSYLVSSDGDIMRVVSVTKPGDHWYIVVETEMVSGSPKVVVYGSVRGGLPPVTAADAGKVLTVDSTGAWVVANLPVLP